MLTDLFVSDLDADQALKDIFANGDVMTVASDANLRVEIIIWDNRDNAIAIGLAELADQVTHTSTERETVEALQTASTADEYIRFVIIPDEPCADLPDSDDMSVAKRAANSTVAQALAITRALDLTHTLKSASDDLFFAIAYHSAHFRNNGWETSPNTVAFSPVGSISLSDATNAQTVVTGILSNYEKVDVGDQRLNHHEGAAITIDALSDPWSCTCRIKHQNERYEVKRYFPVDGIECLPRAFMSLTDKADWHIRDSIGAVDNLVDDDEWTQQSSTAVLGACIASVRTLTQRRTPKVEEFIEAAETAAVVEPIVEAPDDPLPDPPPPEPSPPSTPAPLTWRETLLRLVKERYGEDEAKTIDAVVGKLDDNLPYTLILGADNTVHALQGALPPGMLVHLTKTTRMLSLLTDTGNTTRVHISSDIVRIGRLRIDMSSFLQSDRFVVYLGKSKKSTASNVNRRSYINQRNQRGSVPRLVRQVEIAKSLLKR